MARIALMLAALASFRADRALAQAPTPALSILSYTNGQARLQSTATSASEMRFEGSFDLANWFFIRSLPATSEKVEIVHSNTPPASTMFFRTRPGSPLEPIRIAAQPDTNLTAAALITPEAGVRMAVTSPEGVRFEFVADTNTVTEATPVRMTVITNFTSFPDHDGFRTAVSFEPDGLEFRQSARLTITFPGTIPVPDMLGYSFDGDGSGFHLTPSRPTSNAVELAVIHFSGVGVARFSRSTPPTFDKAWTTQRDARYAANDRAARRDRQVIKDLYSGRITEGKADFEFDHNELTRIFEIYKNGVQPFLEAATKDCAIGRGVVAAELERLSSETRRFTGGSDRNFFDDELAKIMPAVRCNCAHELIRRCESDPKASGSALLHALDDLLLDARLVTRRTDAQGCDLGSDDQIRARLVSGPCFGTWEGTVTLTEVRTQEGTVEAQAGAVKQTFHNETRLVYNGSVKRIKEQKSFVVRGTQVESWVLETDGTSQIGVRIDEQTISDFPDSDTVTTATVTASESQSYASTGDIVLRFENGKFAAIGIGGGRTPESMPYEIRHNSSYRCKSPRPPNNPCPKPGGFSFTSSIGGFQGYSADSGSPDVSVTETPNSITITWRDVSEFLTPSSPPQKTENRFSVSLTRKPNN